MSATPQRMLDAVTSRRALTGFFLSGLMFSLLGAILPAWGYHLKSAYSTVGLYFLSVTVGILASIRISRALLPSRGISFVLTCGATLGCVAILFLAAVSGPVAPWWRMLGLALVGLGGALVNTAVLHAISDVYQHDPAGTVNLAGAMFGLGCLLTSLLVAGTFYIYTVPSILILLATLPGFLAGLYWKWPFPADPLTEQPSPRQAFHDFRSPGALLFSLLLLLQFGNEWSVAGWLPLFLVQRLGISPESSLWLLSLYWLALLVGRIAVQGILPGVSHARLLLASVVAALFGCIVLSLTNSVFGAVTAVLLVGGGFAPIYPLVVEKIGRRFPYYHRGLFGEVLSLALSGGLLAPWILGYLADWKGIGVVMVLPLLGTCLVFILLLLIWLEAKMSEAEAPSGT